VVTVAKVTGGDSSYGLRPWKNALAMPFSHFSNVNVTGGSIPTGGMDVCLL